MNNYKKDICLIDAYPGKAQYQNGETVTIYIDIINKLEEITDIFVNFKVYNLDRQVLDENEEYKAFPGLNTWEKVINITSDETDGYGVEIRLSNQVISTAFDVAGHWSERPRYGFLSDFYDSDEDDIKDIIQMNKYHLNVIQFYDWMYKHEKLVPDDDYYLDLLGRKLSRKAVYNKINNCHKYGMKTMAYGAIYAASKEFYESHKDWALYTNHDQPQNLGNWFYIMNISKDSPWFNHIINQYKQAVEELNFDGIHMDTYGFPKTAYSKLNGKKRLEKLNKQFPYLIESTRNELKKSKEDIGLIFNAVSNWGIEDLSESKQDVLYIEVWDPQDKYLNLYHLINRARELGKKQVILAAYYKFFKDTEGYTYEECKNAFLIATSVIFASGGFQILLGEENGVLSDPYYVNYEKIKNCFEREVRNYYDFAVRYGNLLYSLKNEDCSMTYTNGENKEIVFSNGTFSSYPQANSIWTVIKRQPGYYIIQLVNMTGIESEIWNEGKKQRPLQVENIEVSALIDEDVISVFLASPDFDNCTSTSLEFTYDNWHRGRVIKFKIPILYIWNLIYIVLES